MEPVVTPKEMDYALRAEHLDDVLKEYEKFPKKYIEIQKVEKDFYFAIYLEQGPRELNVTYQL